VAELFARDYAGGQFVWLGPAHLGALACIVMACLAVSRLRLAIEGPNERLRFGLAAWLVVNELAWHIWKAAVGEWTIQTMLPLQLCSVMVWVSAAALATRNPFLYELVYFLGIGGAVQALLTPDLGIYGFPHFRFFQTMTSHGLIIISAVALTSLERMRPTWASLARVVLWIHGYMAVIFNLNTAIGSNYLMLNGKPGTPSLLDLLPPWPAYIAFMEVIGLATLLLLYLPFETRDRKQGAPELHSPPT
jgi:hypothetical integral membrane protein (TIGR02206 family)